MEINAMTSTSKLERLQGEVQDLVETSLRDATEQRFLKLETGYERVEGTKPQVRTVVFRKQAVPMPLSDKKLVPLPRRSKSTTTRFRPWAQRLSQASQAWKLC